MNNLLQHEKFHAEPRYMCFDTVKNSGSDRTPYLTRLTGPTTVPGILLSLFTLVRVGYTNQTPTHSPPKISFYKRNFVVVVVVPLPTTHPFWLSTGKPVFFKK